MGANGDSSKCKVCHVGVGMRGRGSETRGGGLELHWAWSSEEEGTEAEPGACAPALKTKGVKFAENKALGLVALGRWAGAAPLWPSCTEAR